MRVLFFANDLAHKQPRGALELNQQLFLRIGVEKFRAHSVSVLLIKDGENEVEYAMQLSGSDHEYDFYEFRLNIGSTGLYFYHFLVRNEWGEHHIGKGSDLKAVFDSMSKWQLSVYKHYFQPSTAFLGETMYHIFVDRFAIGSKRFKSNPKNLYREDWGGIPNFAPNQNGEYAVDFFGGNLDGIRQKLPYLKQLGVGIIYLSPIFEARSNHKYDTADYLSIDPDFGSIEDFKRLSNACKQNGIKLMLDGVFSHTGSDSIYFNKYGNYDSVGAYQSVNSEFFSWYDFEYYPHKYRCWWGIPTLPNVNETDPKYDAFINGDNGVAQKWLELGADAWRLDVADELPDKFLDRFAAAVKHKKPSAVIVGEVWEDASNKSSYGQRRRYFEGRQLDSVMNYPLKNAIIEFVLGGDARGLQELIDSQINNYPKHTLDSLMNILGSHDTARILTVLSDQRVPFEKADRATFTIQNRDEAKARLKLAATLQFMLYGVPCIFYGDEIGMEGCEDPFCRKCFAWGNEDRELLDFYTQLSAIRSQHKSVFMSADYEGILARDSVIAFRRGNIVVIVNRGARFEYQSQVELVSLLGCCGNGKSIVVEANSAVILIEKNN